MYRLTDYTINAVETGSKDWSEFHSILRFSLLELDASEEYDPAFHDRYGEFSRRDQLLLRFRGEAIGAVTLDLTAEGKCVARGVAIRKDRQGQGHGSAMVELVARFAASAGARELCVNAGAITSRFYKACGFVARVWSREEIRNWNADGAQNPLPVQMVKQLT